MQDERYFILKMVEEGKISAVEAMALIEALDPGEDRPSNTDEEPDPSDKDPNEAEGEEDTPWSAFSKEIGEQIKESVKIAVKNMPYLAEELKDSWDSVKEDVRRSLSEVRDEVNKGIAIDIGGVKRVLYRGRPEFTFVDEIEQTWPSGDGLGEEHDVRHVTLLTQNGSIAVRGWDEPHFKVAVRKQVRGIADGNEAKKVADAAVKIDWDDGKLDVIVNHHERVSASIEAFLPQTLMYDLDAATRNGGVIIEGIKLTKAKSTSTNGGITVSNTSSHRMVVNTTNGRIFCDDVRGDEVYVTTTNGGVVWKGTGEHVTLLTTNGTVRAEPKVVSGTSRLDIKTSNASIKVTLPREDDVALDVRAAGGFVDTTDVGHVKWEVKRGDPQCPTQVVGRSVAFDEADRRMVLDLETSNGRVDLRTKSGD